MRQRLENSFGADLGGVRVHGDSQATKKADRLGAKAFTLGPNIVLGSGADADDLGLMAHEAAHTIQQRGGGALQRFTAIGWGDAHEHEAQRASDAVLRGESFSVQQQTSPRPQGLKVFGYDLSLPDPLEWLAGKANIIPGFRMFTIVLGVNPINMSPVDRSGANILRAMIEFLPGGSLVTQALDSSGVFEKAGAFVDRQIKSIGLVGSAIKASVTEFVAGLSLPGDLLHPVATWERAKRIFTEPIDRIKSFWSGLVAGIVQLVKDAILKPIAKLAEGTEGYNLLKGVLGKDPITDEAVQPSAETLLGPIMRMAGQGEIWAKMQQAKAIPRCWAWFKGVISQLKSFVSRIPGLFISAFKSLTLEDIILIPKAFMKLAKIFGGFIGDFISWGVNAVWKLLEIVFDVVSPNAWGYIQKTGAALKSILKNPLPFVGNLVNAAKLGFTNFGGNFLNHLKKGLIDWLTGSLEGVYIPKALSLIEFGKMALSILGISWAQIRGKIVKVLGPNGEMIMQGLETAFDVVKALVTGGPAAAWEVIKDKLSGLKDTVVQGIIDFVKDAVITKAIPKLIAMFIPGAGFISAIVSIYDTVKVFVEKISKIIQVVTAFINSIVAIAAGNIGAAASKVESILANLLSLAISFLAGFVGLGKVTGKVMEVINKVRTTVDKAIDAAIAWIVAKANALFAKLFSKKKDEEDPEKRLDKAVAGIGPAVDAMLAKGSTGLIFKAKLLIWKVQYKLTSLTVEDGQLVAAVNPRRPFKRLTPAQVALIRREIHAACVEISSSAEVQKMARDIIAQKKKGRGTLAKPILVAPQGGLLGAAEAQRQGMGTKPFERTAYQLAGTQTPVQTLQTFSQSPSHTIVGPRSSPDPIGKYADYQKHLAARGLSDLDVRVGLQLLAQGQPLPANLAKHEGFISGMTFLLGSTEVARIPSQAAALPIAVAAVPLAGLPQQTPAAPRTAIAANRVLDVGAGVPGATMPSSTPDPAAITQIIKTTADMTEQSIGSKVGGGELIFATPQSLQTFLAKDLRGMVKTDILRGFGMQKG